MNLHFDLRTQPFISVASRFIKRDLSRYTNQCDFRFVYDIRIVVERVVQTYILGGCHVKVRYIGRKVLMISVHSKSTFLLPKECIKMVAPATH